MSGQKAPNPGPPSGIGDIYGVSRNGLRSAFAEWERRYRQDPEKFMSEMDVRALDTNDYGALAADTLLALMGLA